MNAAETPIPDALVLEIAGPGVTPSTVDAALMLELSAALVALVAKNAEEDDLDLSLSGLRIINKCAAVVVGVNQMVNAERCAVESLRQVAGVTDGPKGSATLIARVRDAHRSLPPGHTAKVIVGPWARKIEPASAEPPPLDSILSVRATLMRVGGNDPVARFSSPIEAAPFTLRVSKQQAKELGHLLYQSVDIEARVARDAEGGIARGKLDRYARMDEGDPVELWGAWYRKMTAEDAGADGGGGQ